MSDKTQPHHKIGIIGYGFVGRGTAHALGRVADIAFHDPAVAGSKPLADIVSWADMLVVCVPTPIAESGGPDLSMVLDVMRRLSDIGARCPVVLKSTVPPGTSEGVARQWPSMPLVFCPEFLRERHSMEDSLAPSRIVLGWTSGTNSQTKATVRHFYGGAFEGVPLVEMDSTSAELLKYASNALFGVKVSFANEMAELAQSLSIPWEPIRAALVLDPRVGSGHLAVPGPDGRVGFGGSCLPKDIASLLSFSRMQAVAMPVVSASFEANSHRRRNLLPAIDGPVHNSADVAGGMPIALRKSQNIYQQALTIRRGDRERLNQHSGKVVWLTGLSGSGKSTIANALEVELHAQGKRTYILDGDNIRQGLSKDLGFADVDRVENIRRIAEVSKLMMDAGLMVITAFISPFRQERQAARELIGAESFVEVFVDTPLSVCEQRDPKGLYKKARSGQLANMTGIDSPYEAPKNPEVALNGQTEKLEDMVLRIVEVL